MKGFTVFEILVTITLMVVLVLLTTVNIEGFRRSSLVAEASREITTTLESAKSKTLAGEAGVAYKVSFTATSYQISKSDGTVISNNIIDQSLQIVPPAGDITFAKLTGNSNGGTVIIRYKSGTPQKIITVSTYGMVSEQ